MGPHPLASAVVLPSPSPPPPLHHTTDLKRPHDSFTTAPTSPKRQRLSPPPARLDSAPHQRPRQSEESLDRKRTQRLFGSLLNPRPPISISRPPRQPSKPSHPSSRPSRNPLVHDPAVVRKDHTAIRTQVQKPDVVALSQRRQRQRDVDARNMRVRHANMRLLAGFLKTETEPVVFWRPGVCRVAEEVRVRGERERVEVVIAEETRETERGLNGGDEEQSQRRVIDEDEEGGGDVEEAEEGGGRKTVRDVNERDGDDGSDAAGAVKDAPDGGNEQHMSGNTAETNTIVAEERRETHDPDVLEKIEEGKGDLDETGDVVVEGEEDTVIY